MRVYFNIPPKARGRHYDTYAYAPKQITALKPNVVVKEGVAKKNKPYVLPFLRFFPFLLRFKSISVDADLVYNIGSFLLTKNNYVVELDNPYCLTYYSIPSARNPIIRFFIDKFVKAPNFKGFVCISNACKKSLKKEFGYEGKVVYPVAPEPKNVSVEPSFIFISYKFLLKGGREILRALKQVKGRYRFTMVTNMPSNFSSIAKSLGVDVVSNVPREKLLNDIIPKHAVCVHPTYQDSFGIALYECINTGLAAIATDVYAIPEFVEHGKNGFLIRDPVNYYNDFTPNLKFWVFDRVMDYVKEHTFPDVSAKIAEYIQYYIDNPKEIKKHQRYSKKLHNSRFCLSIRNNVFLELLGY